MVGPFVRSRGLDRGPRRGGGRRGRGRRRARHPPRTGSGASPASPAGRNGCRATSASVRWPTMSRPRRIHDRRASSRRMPVDFGDGGRRGRRPDPVVRARRTASPTAARARRDGRAGRRCGPDGPWPPAGRRAGRGRAGPPSGRPAAHHRSPGPRRASPGVMTTSHSRPDAAGDGLDRVEAARQVQPGDDRTGRLGLGGESVDEGRPPARAVAADGDAGRLREAAGSQDRVERGEAGPDDTVGRVGAGFVPWPDVGEWRQVRGGRQGEGPIRDPRSCRSPASLEARHGSRHVRGRGRHRTIRLEHPF